MIYFILPLLSFIASSLSVLKIQGTKHLHKLLGILIVFVYFIIVGLRGEGIGTDYYQYEGFFGNPYYTEPGFALLMIVTKAIFNNYHFFLVVLFCFNTYLRIKLFRLASKEVSISLLMMFGFWMLVYDMNGIRQGFSLSFIGWAGYYAYKKNLKLFLVFAAIATSIHYSSFLFFIFYFFVNKVNFEKKKMLFIIIFLYILALFNISGYLFSFFVNSSASGILVDKVDAYSKMNEYNSNTVFSFNTFHRIFIFLVVFFTIDKISADKDFKKFLLMAAFLNISVFLLMSRFEIIAVRGSLPFRFFELIFFSYLPFCFKNKHTQFWVTFLLYLYICFQIFTTINVKNDVDNTLMPYKNILFG